MNIPFIQSNFFEKLFFSTVWPLQFVKISFLGRNAIICQIQLSVPLVCPLECLIFVSIASWNYQIFWWILRPPSTFFCWDKAQILFIVLSIESENDQINWISSAHLSYFFHLLKLSYPSPCCFSWCL